VLITEVRPIFDKNLAKMTDLRNTIEKAWDNRDLLKEDERLHISGNNFNAQLC